MTISAVIFDLDGTLLDTERLVTEAGLKAMARMGLDPQADILRDLVGQAEAVGQQRLLAHVGTDRIDAFNDVWSQEIQRHYGAGIPLMPGVLDLLAAIDLPMAVATNSLTAGAIRKLAKAGLGGRFLVVLGRDKVTSPKPAPDLYLLAAQRLGVPAADCVVFEDSPVGVLAGHSAGMRVIHVPDQHHAPAPGATIVAPSLLEGARAIGLI